MNWNILILLIVSAQAFSIPLNREQNTNKQAQGRETYKWILKFEMFDRPMFVEAKSLDDLQNEILDDLISLNLVHLKEVYKMPVKETADILKFISVIRAG